MAEKSASQRYRFWWVFLAAYLVLLAVWLFIPIFFPKVQVPKDWPETDISGLNSGKPTEVLASAVSEMPVPDTLPAEADWAALKMGMLELINQSRQEADIPELLWHDLAASAAQQHAEEMAEQAYLSHWNRQGEGADMRFARIGGSDVVSENVYAYSHRYDSGTPVPVEDWDQYLFEAHESFMNSIQHRENILSPEHTHVGIGLAYQPETGEFRVVQEFLNQYIDFLSHPQEIGLAEPVVINGALLNGAGNPLAVLYYEPFPEPLSIDALNQTAVFQSAAEQVGIVSIIDQGNGQFSVTLPIREAVGVYHLRFWGMVGENQVPISDLIFWANTGGLDDADQMADAIVETGKLDSSLESAADFLLPDLEGTYLSISQFSSRPVLLVFFRTGEVFEQQARYLQGLMDDDYYPSLKLIGLSLEEPAVLLPSVEALGLTFPVISNTSGSVFSQYPLEGFPGYVFINPEGKLESVLSQPASLGALEIWLDQLIQE
jgi:uncharacterized protein YkwD/peroxiredoxin